MNTSPLNILVVHHFAELGGAERSLLQALSYLSEQKDVRVHLLSPEGALSSQLPKQIHFRKMEFRPFSRNPLKLMFSVFLLLRNAISAFLYCRRHHINRLYIGSIKSLIVTLPSRILLRIPLIYHLRDFLRGWLLPALLRLFANRVVSVSAFIQRQIVRHVDSAKCRVIYNGIPAGESIRNTPSEVKTVGFAGQLVPWKRVELLIEAYRKVRERHPHLQLKIAGRAHFEKDKSYEQQLREDCSNDRGITFTGWRDDIHTFLQEVDLLVLPSKDEPFGRVLVEAMLAGVPVIGVNSGAIPEIIEDGVNGLVCEATPQQLAEALERIIRDKDLRTSCAEHGIVIAQQRFSAQRYGREVYECLRDAQETY